jgi:hypothetical protein
LHHPGLRTTKRRRLRRVLDIDPAIFMRWPAVNLQKNESIECEAQQEYGRKEINDNGAGCRQGESFEALLYQVRNGRSTTVS